MPSKPHIRHAICNQIAWLSNKKGGVVLSAYHATQGRRFVAVYHYEIIHNWFAGRLKSSGAGEKAEAEGPFWGNGWFNPVGPPVAA